MKHQSAIAVEAAGYAIAIAMLEADAVPATKHEVKAAEKAVAVFAAYVGTTQTESPLPECLEGLEPALRVLARLDQADQIRFLKVLQLIANCKGPLRSKQIEITDAINAYLGFTSVSKAESSPKRLRLIGGRALGQGARKYSEAL